MRFVEVHPLNRGCGSICFVVLLILAVVASANACFFLLGNYDASDFNLFQLRAAITDEHYWIKHFSHLPGVAADARRAIAGYIASYVIGILGLAVYLAPLVATVTVFTTTVHRRRYTNMQIRVAMYSLLAAILLALGTPQY